jgi:hypothetical protein
MLKQYRLHVIVVSIVALLVVLASVSVVSAGKPTPTPPPGPTPTSAPPPPGPLLAGLRASNYGISPWPSPTWWVNSINSMASRFPGSTGTMIAVVVETNAGGGGCWAHFPNPDGGSYPSVTFDGADLFDADFAAFDQNGIKVWLQVEPANCDVSMLIDLVMRRYGSHTSVIGFGVDGEWYQSKAYKSGKPVTDAEAQAWVLKTRSYNANYQVFLKHWLVSKMPPTYRTGLVFIDDSQGFSSLSAMVSEFAAWGQAFTGAPVGFQFGYASDKRWWSQYADPPKTIGDALLAQIPNTKGLCWVDFTAYDIWPQ